MFTEDGLGSPQRASPVRPTLPCGLAAAAHGLTATARQGLHARAEELRAVDQRIAATAQPSARVLAADEGWQRLAQRPGIGPRTAPALVAAVGAAPAFNPGRQGAAWLGLVSRQHATGGKPTRLGLTKRGNRSLRPRLIHGARAVLRGGDRKTEPRSRWLPGGTARRGQHWASGAQAKKTARVAWALGAKGAHERQAA